MMTTPDFLVGTWTYRSFLSNPDIDADFDSLEFGRGLSLIHISEPTRPY